MTNFDDSLHPRTRTGKFAEKNNSDPSVSLTPAPAQCIEGCGKPGTLRAATQRRGHRAPDDRVFCEEHGTATDIEVENIPRPQEPGESIVWLIEGDDHELETVEAVTEDEALDLAAESFNNRYEPDDDEEFDESSARDIVTVVGTFRGEQDSISELEFVPYGDLTENDAFRHLNNF